MTKKKSFITSKPVGGETLVDAKTTFDNFNGQTPAAKNPESKYYLDIFERDRPVREKAAPPASKTNGNGAHFPANVRDDDDENPFRTDLLKPILRVRDVPAVGQPEPDQPGLSRSRDFMPDYLVNANLNFGEVTIF